MSKQIFNTSQISELWQHLKLNDSALVDEFLFNHYLDSGADYLSRNRFRISSGGSCSDWSEDYAHDCFKVEISSESLTLVINGLEIIIDFSKYGDLWHIDRTFQIVPNSEYCPPDGIALLIKNMPRIQLSNRGDILAVLTHFGFNAKLS